MINEKRINARIAREQKAKENCAAGLEYIKKHNLTIPFQTDNHIVRDILCFLLKNGSISQKQHELVIKIYEADKEYKGRKEEEKRNSKPVIEGRGEISGVILSTREQGNVFYTPGRYSYSNPIIKILLQDHRGFKLWGTMPKHDNTKSPKLGKGDVIKFIATVKKSPDDETFGWFSRPGKIISFEKWSKL